jgi:hypothetical protein
MANKTARSNRAVRTALARKPPEAAAEAEELP